MPLFAELDGEQIRQLINTEQTYAAYRTAQTEYQLRFRGSMSWKTVSGRHYLYRKSAGGEWKSLGRRSAETEHILDRFRSGRAAAKERIASLDATIRRMALINRAMGLGRVPWVAGRLLRRLDKKQLLGRAVSVVGTHSLYAYERMAGGHFGRSQLATLDIDPLYDARDRLRLLAPDVVERGLTGILEGVDNSFEPVTEGAFRAVNAKGFMVDLIRPPPKEGVSARDSSRIGSGRTDMTAAEIEGLAWLQNSPQVHQTVIDDRGYPLPLVVPDPRAFALHKLWVSERSDRDRVKARRDVEQAEAVAWLVMRYLPQLRFEDPALRALPEALRGRAAELMARARGLNSSRPDDW